MADRPALLGRWEVGCVACGANLGPVALGRVEDHRRACPGSVFDVLVPSGGPNVVRVSMPVVRARLAVGIAQLADPEFQQAIVAAGEVGLTVVMSLLAEVPTAWVTASAPVWNQPIR